MRLGEISFCNKIGFNVKSDEFKKFVLDEIELNFKKKIIQKHYDKFNEQSLDCVNNNPHMMCLRSNGNPYFLYLTKYNDVNQCIFIDKKIQQGYCYPRMVITKMWFDDILFNNTLFDGEMIKDNNDNWLFIINDLIGDSGKDQMKTNLIKRINRCIDIFDNQYIHDSNNLCYIQIKRYFHYEQFDYMMKMFMPLLPYSCRGIYFVPLFLKFKEILFNFDNSLIKVNQKGKIQKTFKSITTSSTSSSHENLQVQLPLQLPQQLPSELKKEEYMFLQKTTKPDVYEITSCTTEKHVGIACVNNINISKLLKNTFSNSSPIDKFKFKCIYNDKFMKWCPVELIAS